MHSAWMTVLFFLPWYVRFSMGDENEPTLNRTEQCMVLVFAALSIILTTYGIGYHQETVPTADMIMMEKVSALSAI